MHTHTHTHTHTRTHTHTNTHTHTHTVAITTVKGFSSDSIMQTGTQDKAPVSGFFSFYTYILLTTLPHCFMQEEMISSSLTYSEWSLDLFPGSPHMTLPAWLNQVAIICFRKWTSWWFSGFQSSSAYHAQVYTLVTHKFLVNQTHMYFMHALPIYLPHQYCRYNHKVLHHFDIERQTGLNSQEVTTVINSCDTS